MFGWFSRKKNRDIEFMEKLMRAAAEGNSRANVNRALGSIGIQIAHEPDNAQYCIRASSAIVRVISGLANDPIEEMTDSDERFVAGIFSFVVCNHLTRIIGAPFAIVASIVPIDLFGQEYAEEISSLGDSFNAMSKQGELMQAIGQCVARWIAEPKSEHLAKLVSLYELCKEHA